MNAMGLLGAREDVGALARARRFLGRVIDSVRTPSERPSERVPSASRTEARGPLEVLRGGHARRDEGTAAPDTHGARREESGLRAAVAFDPVELELEALADAWDREEWQGLRVEDRGSHLLVAWRLEGRRDVLVRTIEVDCAFGELDAAPRTTTEDAMQSARDHRVLASSAARIVIALGTLAPEFTALAHVVAR